MRHKLTAYILGGLVLGIIVGAIMHVTMSNDTITEAAKWLGLVTTVFLRLIKMIIAPLVFATLVSGIVHMGDTASLGRVGLKTMLWFFGATIISLVLGMVLVNWMQPGVGANFTLPPADAVSGIAKPPSDVFVVIAEMFPKSIIEAMGSNILLQIVVFSMFFGVAMTAIGEKAAPITKGIDALVDIMLEITKYVMRMSPLAVFAAMTKVIAVNGLGILGTFAWFVGSFYTGLVALWSILLAAGFFMVGKRIFELLGLIREPILLAFSTASSESAYPQTLAALDKFGVPKKIATFVLPMGYSFNLDGSMMYMTFATIFIAQLYGINFTLGQELTMLLTLMLTSKGMASVPRASLVVVSGTMAQFNIPEAGLVLILAIDQFLDMGRTGTNVVGNSIAAVAIARWEGAFGKNTQAPDVRAAEQ